MSTIVSDQLAAAPMKQRRVQQAKPTTKPEATDGAAELQQEILRLQDKIQRQEAEQAYRQVQQRVTDFIHAAVPRGSTVLVVSKGDDDLLDVSGRIGWHFPRAVNGLYAGCYPANSREAVLHLRKLQRAGAQYLAFPSPSFWWLKYYGGLTRHLQRRHRLIAYHEEICLIYRLLDRSSALQEAQQASQDDDFGN